MRRAYPYAFFLILVCAFLWRPIFAGRALLPGDYLAGMKPWNTVIKADASGPQWNALSWDALAQFYPWRVFYAKSMSSGRIPLWNPYQFHGTPFLANGQSAVLYPPNALFLIFDPITAFTIFAALHLFLAAAFTYMLLRRLGCRELGGIVGAVTFTFSAFMVLWLELPTFISAAVYLPLTLLLVHMAVERRSVFYAALSGGSVAMAFLAGHFQIAFYVGLAAAAWWVWKLAAVRRSEGRTYAAIVVGGLFVAFLLEAGLISAGQFLPSVELARSSHRSGAPTLQGYSRFTDNGVKGYRLVTAFVPDFYGSPARRDYFLGSAADYMEYGMYAGILPLALALIGLVSIRKRAHVGYFAGLAGLALLTAVGTPINYLFYYLVPGFSSLGGPNRILLLYVFSVAALAGFGIDAFAERAGEQVSVRGLKISWGMLAAFVALAVVAATFLVTQLAARMFIEELTSQAFDVPWAGFAAFLLISAIVLFARASGSLKQPAFAVLAVLIVAADLFAFGVNFNPTCDRSKVYPETKLTRELEKIAGDQYIAPINPSWSLIRTPEAILPPNAAMVYGLHDVQGYDSLYTREYKDLSSRIQGEDCSPQENGNMVLIRRPTPDLGLLADYVVSARPIDEARLCDGRLLESVDGVYVYELNEGDGNWRDPSPSPRPSPSGGEGAGIESRYQPFSFRFGLFLTLLGVLGICLGAALTVAGRLRSRGRSSDW